MRFILAEYCPGPFYAGWWLYDRDSNDGRLNVSGGHNWGWLRDEEEKRRVYDLCVELGHDPPVVSRYSQKFAEWFAATFPNGLRVRRKRGGECGYSFVECPATRPRQRPGVIRTIRGAARARAASLRAERAICERGNEKTTGCIAEKQHTCERDAAQGEKREYGTMDR